MGSSQSSPVANITPVSSTKIPEGKDGEKKLKSKVLNTPIFMEGESEQEQADDEGKFPSPSGHEYDLMDRIASELPSVIDEESQQQVDDYRTACDGGKGPMVACFATAEFVSLFERKHKDAFKLYESTCFRSKKDKSANGVLVDGTKAYPPACFNMAQVLMTGKGGNPFDRAKGYKIFDRACRGGHGGACHMQAKMLLSEPGELGPGVPYNPKNAARLLQQVCDNGDPISCFTLATMLLRGDEVSSEASNVRPQEARGETKIEQRVNEADRAKTATDSRVGLQRDPPRAEQLLIQGCMTNGHAPSCYNLAVMYTQGDDGVSIDEEKAREYQEKTEEMVEKFGGFGM